MIGLNLYQMEIEDLKEKREKKEIVVMVILM